MPRPISAPPFTEAALRDAVEKCICWADCLRLLGYETKGHNFRTVQRWVRNWEISTDHFDPARARGRGGRGRVRPLSEVMVENSSYERGSLKRRLIADGIKTEICEMCGQGSLWLGQHMSMILDHINGIANDHRLENLRMLCPNCAATLETHCGRNTPRERTCPTCGQTFRPTSIRHRYCSTGCWDREAHALLIGIPRPETRKVERPPLEQLLRDLEEANYSAVGRKYGVSDNAVRKWLRWYENERIRNSVEAGLPAPNE